MLLPTPRAPPTHAPAPADDPLFRAVGERTDPYLTVAGGVDRRNNETGIDI
jgi:hypothetical protein